MVSSSIELIHASDGLSYRTHAVSGTFHIMSHELPITGVVRRSTAARLYGTFLLDCTCIPHARASVMRSKSPVKTPAVSDNANHVQREPEF